MTAYEIENDYAAWLSHLSDDYDAPELTDEFWDWEAEQRKDEAAGIIPPTDAEIEAMCKAAGYDAFPPKACNRPSSKPKRMV